MTAPTPVDIGRIAIDPRFRARRIEVRREAGRRRLRRLVVLVIVAALALATVIVLESPILDVDEVAVRGATVTDADAIREAAGVRVGSPLLLADLERAEAAVEALPWVDDATVTRRLPSGIEVEVTERTPRAVVVVGGATAVVDGSGRVLERDRSPGVGTARFVAVIPDGDLTLPAPGAHVDGGLRDAIALAGRLGEDPAGAVAAVRLAPSPSFDLREGGRVHLGDLTELDAKIEAFRTVHARVDLQCLATIDLRVPTHPVLTRRTACS